MSGGATEVLPGLWSLRTPIPGHELAHVLIYAFEHHGGLTLVDAGWPSEGALLEIRRSLAQIGASTADIGSIVVTHAHPDHYGLAGALQNESDASIALHKDDVPLVAGRYGYSAIHRDDALRWLRALGAPECQHPTMLDELCAPWGPEAPLPDRLLADRDVLEIGDRRLTVVHTPGHTPGHIILVDPASSIAIVGDLVLPTITPNVSSQPGSAGNPLARFLGSLDRARAFGDLTALPGHEHPFPSMGIRIDELQAHHAARLEEIAGLLSLEPCTAWDIAAAIAWAIPWSMQTPFSRRLALGEAHAHLVWLRDSGRCRELAGEPSLWTKVVSGHP